MFDTYVTIVGNVLTAPEWRRTTQSGTLVANFKVASTARRLDRDSGRWVDGNSLRVRVNCWRRLAEGVAASVAVGDPVIVAGRLYTRDWTDEAGTHRTLYELEAVAVGHDLSRGRARFLRNQPRAATSTVQDAEAEQRVHGEATEPVPDAHAPATFDDRPFDDDVPPPEYGGSRVGLVGTVERVGEPDPFDTRPGARATDYDGGPEEDELGDTEDDGPVTSEDDELGEVPPSEVDGSGPSGPGEGEAGGAGPGAAAGTASGRRGRRRTPVPA
ncbi:single-stranded DNA-binding protein [Micromonospora sp. WMMD1076]|uniref:single-stranded DNA-binding protein n=1 Tax=Micromonospora sp. WMMD1076 TaxID=3016103 RepID=UPI00249BAB64|nr:single-stranded DNA-binding protein [Micromonospora sp. WMMD1076]WFF06723.1 single-stranded DNA-binding protein [Micromonospora sp. WMMD1076]